VTDDGPVAVADEVPLNLRMRRAPFARVDRTPSKQTLQLAGVLASGALLLASTRRGGRFGMAAAVALGTGSIAALIATIAARRRHCVRDAAIDEQVEQSFPASDPPAL
jgi:hypothetical protein